MNRPQPNEYSPYAQGYIDCVGDDVFADLERQASYFPDLIASLPEEKGDYAYAEGKWTVRECAGHIIDTERIMTYRALRIGRNDKAPLPGFEQDDYVVNSHYNDRSLKSLAEEFRLLRASNLFLLRSFNEEELRRTGTASNYPASTLGIIFIIAGHVNHHLNLFRERYGIGS